MAYFATLLPSRSAPAARLKETGEWRWSPRNERLHRPMLVERPEHVAPVFHDR